MREALTDIAARDGRLLRPVWPVALALDELCQVAEAADAALSLIPEGKAAEANRSIRLSSGP